MSRKDSALKYFEKYKEYTDKRVESGIELYRKGTAEITVKYADGSEVSNLVIKAKQKNHEFKYGANVFMLGELHDETKESAYRDSFAKTFNIATLPFYWNSVEPEEGKHRYSTDSPEIYRRPPIDLCMEYCKERGIEPKAHCLNYDWFTPDWAIDLPVPEFKKKLEKRFFELAERYGDKIKSWEVTNETFSVEGRKTSKFFFERDFVEWSYDMAQRYFPNNHLIINDYYFWDRKLYGDRSSYFMQIERLLNKGKHIDSIGFQMHSFFPLEMEEGYAEERYNPMVWYRILDNYAVFGKKIQITETTIPAYSDAPEDEEVQAELIKNLYRVWFSHPSMEAIIYWNLVDGYAFSRNARGRDSIGDYSGGENQYRGGLLRFDMSEKPALKVIQDLFGKEWRTEVTVKSDNSEVLFRGFYGDYELEILADGKTIKKDILLSSNTHNKFEIII